MSIDFELSGYGRVYLPWSITRAGQIWIDERLPADANRFGSAFASDQRYVGVIIPGTIQNGLAVR